MTRHTWPCRAFGLAVFTVAALLGACSDAPTEAVTALGCEDSPCLNGAACNDTDNGFVCDCAAGFEGTTCGVNSDDCAAGPCANGTCVDLVDGYLCQCPPGFDGPTCGTEVAACADVVCHNGGTCEVQPDGVADCVCADGFDGPSCANNIDDCADTPCANGATCIDQVAGVVCVCADGFEGDACEHNTDECADAPCHNGGACTDQVAGFSCACAAGFEGPTCAINRDDCDPDPCAGGGTCVDAIDGFVCVCPPGLTGTTCEGTVDHCATEPCLNDASCTSDATGFACDCPEGWSGERCEVNVDACDPNPCGAGAECIDQVVGFICACPDGFAGDTCDVDIDDCADAPCHNGGTCTDAPAGFVCDCPAGFSGATCAVNIDDCTPNPCGAGATCLDGVNSTFCQCANGMTGALCDVPIDDCAAAPCQNGGTCTDEVDGFSCTCTAGWEGTFCANNVDDCATDPCDHGGTCLDQVNAFVCECPAGYAGPTCSDNVDDCADAPCNNGGTCTDGVDSFTCECPAGFSGDTCADNDDDCAGEPCDNGGTCVDQVAGFVCVCAPGFAGDTCTDDVDDCADNPCLNGGTCDDAVDGFSCTCADGFSGSTCGVNDDDCAGEPCGNGGTCVDLVDGYFCDCPPGFGGATCGDDLDECAASPCLNGGVCTDAVAGFSCACATGFTGDTCAVNVDDCAAAPCLNGGTCFDQVDAFVCVCAAGFSGPTCSDDVDDCADAPCHNGGTCTDAVAGFVCDCPDGFSGDTCAVNDDDCAAAPCANGGTCYDLVAGFSCVCPSGYAGATCADDIDDCADAPCQNGGTCTDAGPNAFTCACPIGWDGPTCELDVPDCATDGDCGGVGAYCHNETCEVDGCAVDPASCTRASVCPGDAVLCNVEPIDWGYQELGYLGSAFYNTRSNIIALPREHHEPHDLSIRFQAKVAGRVSMGWDVGLHRARFYENNVTDRGFRVSIIDASGDTVDSVELYPIETLKFAGTINLGQLTAGDYIIRAELTEAAADGTLGDTLEVVNHPLSKPVGAVVQEPFPAEGVPLKLTGPMPTETTTVPISTGVPLAETTTQRLDTLRVFEDGVPIAANITARSRWTPDGFIRWVGVDFEATLGPGPAPDYRLMLSDRPVPSTPLTVETVGDTLVVNTGPLRFHVNTAHFAGISWAALDLDGDGAFTASEAIVDGPGGPVMTTIVGGSYSAANRPADEQPPTLDRWIFATQEASLLSEVRVEEVGPAKAVIHANGWYYNDAGERLHRYSVYLTAWAGSSRVELDHRTILTRDADADDRITSASFEVATTQAFDTYAFGVEGTDVASGSVPTGGADVFAHQYRSDAFRIVSGGADAHQGERLKGWMRGTFGQASVTAFLHDVYQLYPKEMELRSKADGTGTLALHFWPRHGMDVFDEQELLTRKNVFKGLFAHHGQALTMKTPQSVIDRLWALAESDTDPEDPSQPNRDQWWQPPGNGEDADQIEKAETKFGKGTAFTNEVVLHFGPREEPLSPAAIDAARDRVHAHPEPGYAMSTQVMPFMDARDPATYPRAEEAIGGIRDAHLRLQVEPADLHGMWVYGGTHNGFDYERETPNLHRVWQHSHYSAIGTAWAMYLRGGLHHDLTWATAMTRHLMDVGRINFDTKLRETSGFAGNVRHAKGTIPWTEGAALGSHWSDSSGFLLRYYLTGDYQSRDMAAGWIESVRRQHLFGDTEYTASNGLQPFDLEPTCDGEYRKLLDANGDPCSVEGVDGCTLVDRTPTYMRNRLTGVSEMLEQYYFSHDPNLAKLVGHAGHFYANTKYECSLGWTSHPVFQIHAWPRILHFYRDPRIGARLGEYLESIGHYNGFRGSGKAAAVAAHYFFTGDTRHLVNAGRDSYFDAILGTITDPTHPYYQFNNGGESFTRVQQEAPYMMAALADAGLAYGVEGDTMVPITWEHHLQAGLFKRTGHPRGWAGSEGQVYGLVPQAGLKTIIPWTDEGQYGLFEGWEDRRLYDESEGEGTMLASITRTTAPHFDPTNWIHLDLPANAKLQLRFDRSNWGVLRGGLFRDVGGYEAYILTERRWPSPTYSQPRIYALNGNYSGYVDALTEPTEIVVEIANRVYAGAIWGKSYFRLVDANGVTMIDSYLYDPHDTVSETYTLDVATHPLPWHITAAGSRSATFNFTGVDELLMAPSMADLNAIMEEMQP